MTHKELDFGEALKDPTAYFESPMDVVNNAQLSGEQKKRVLEQWRQDAVRLQESTAEAMNRGEPSRLDDVEEALRALAES